MINRPPGRLLGASQEQQQEGGLQRAERAPQIAFATHAARINPRVSAPKPLWDAELPWLERCQRPPPQPQRIRARAARPAPPARRVHAGCGGCSSSTACTALLQRARPSSAPPAAPPPSSPSAGEAREPAAVEAEGAAPPLVP
ncbi:unnamed protein product, partial [Prorocentrum cordatum]